MDGIDACGVYFAVRSAFTGDYDYFKYSGQIRITKEAYAIHKNKWQFVELGKKYTDRSLPYFLAANFFLHGTEDTWITKLLQDFPKYDDTFLLWRQWQEDRITNFKIELTNLASKYQAKTLSDLRCLFEPGITGSPRAYDILQHTTNRINHSSTLFMVDRIFHIFNSWDHAMKGDFTWDQHYIAIKKFNPFFEMYKPLSDINIKKTFSLLLPFG